MDRVGQFFKIMFNAFWNHPSRIIRYFNRIMTVLVIFFIFAMTVLIPRHQRNLVNNYRTNYAINDPMQKYYDKHYNKALKYAKEQKKLSNSEKNKPENVIKSNYATKAQMAQNPTTDISAPDSEASDFIYSEIMGHKHLIPNEHKKWLQYVVLNAGQTSYVYEHYLLQSFGIKDVKARFVMTSGDLYIDPKIQNYSPETVQAIKVRAQYIWECSELSMRVRGGLKIHDQLNN